MQVTSRKHGTKTQSGAFGKRKRLGIDPARALSPGDERVHALNIQYERARRHLPLFGKYGKIVREAQKVV